MDEEYNDSVDTSTDMDVSDVDVSNDIPADIPDDIPEDDYSDADVADDFSEDVPEETSADDVEYDDADESVEDDSIESEVEDFDEPVDDIEEDTLEEPEEVSDDYEESDDISEDTAGFDEELENEVDETEDIPEDVDYTEMADRDEAFEEDIPEDVTDTEATDETADVEDTDTSEQPEDMTDADAMDETADIEDADPAEQPDDMTDAEATDEASHVKDTDTSKQLEDITDTEATDETTDVEDADTTEQPENVTETSDTEDTDTAEQSEDMADAESTEEVSEVEDTESTEQPEDVTDTEATDETIDVEDSNTSEQPEDVTDAEATDESTDVEDADTMEQPEDVTDTESTEEASDVESTDTTEQLEDMSDTETADETTDVEDTDTSEQPEDVTDAEATDETAGAEDTDAAEQPEDVTDTEVMDETSDVEDTDTSEQPEDITDAESPEETSNIENTDTSEQAEDMTDTEAADETTDVEDTDAAEQPENVSDTDDANHSDLETYDYETSPETQDAVNPETSGEYVSADNTYRERWEEFADEFSDGKEESNGWDSLKDVPFAGDAQPDVIKGSDTSMSTESNDTSEINNISDYMNAHNYGSDDFATYSQDPQWRQLMRQEYPDYELPELTQESAHAQLSQYMNDHNYGVDDYAEYSQDPIWRELHSTAFSDDELPLLNGTENDSGKEYPTDAGSEGEDLTPFVNGGEDGKNHLHNPDDIIEGEMFGSFETDKHINGSDSFIKGDNYEQFKRDYYSPEESTYEEYDSPKEIDISPSMIEGIHLGERELEDPSVFWSQHENGGTLESFKEIASHIPDVREQLSSGKTMDELLADPELSECTGIYFANKPKVIENDGYYEFDSNGRHRILAAREAGYDIPVEVIGRRDRSGGIDIKNGDSAEEELHANFGEDLPELDSRDDKELGSFADKIRNFFTPSRNADLVEPGADAVTSPNQDVQTKWTPPAIKGVDVKEPAADITPLDATRQSINMLDLPDGSKAKVFDHPNNLRSILPFSQGKNEYAKNGTCALADTGAWLKVAGSRHVENDVVGFASTHSDRQGQPLCSKSGGTLPSNIPDIWEHFGMPAYSDSSKNLESIAAAVESGRAVSVGVNAGTLWEQDNSEGIRIPQNCYGDGGANHAIGVMSCERDPISENITHFYINDTGRTYERDACRRISIGDFWKAFNVKRACATISQKPVW